MAVGHTETAVTRTEVVSVRLTPAERQRLDELGGPAALRRLLAPTQQVLPITTAPDPIFVPARSSVVWFDGTVGPSWPALATY